MDIDIRKMKNKKLIVRVTTTVYKTQKGYSCTKSINVLKRKSDYSLRDIVLDIENDTECLPNNFFDVPDGIYELAYTNETFDIESGHIDSWEYILKPQEKEDD